MWEGGGSAGGGGREANISAARFRRGFRETRVVTHLGRGRGRPFDIAPTKQRTTITTQPSCGALGGRLGGDELAICLPPPPPQNRNSAAVSTVWRERAAQQESLPCYTRLAQFLATQLGRISYSSAPRPAWRGPCQNRHFSGGHIFSSPVQFFRGCDGSHDLTVSFRVLTRDMAC